MHHNWQCLQFRSGIDQIFYIFNTQIQAHVTYQLNPNPLTYLLTIWIRASIQETRQKPVSWRWLSVWRGCRRDTPGVPGWIAPPSGPAEFRCRRNTGRAPAGTPSPAHRERKVSLEGRVADPQWCNADPDPAFFLIADPNSGSRIRIQGWWPKIEKNLQLEI